MKYELKQFDDVLLAFEIERQELGELKYHIVYVNSDKKYLLPIGL